MNGNSDTVCEKIHLPGAMKLTETVSNLSIFMMVLQLIHQTQKLLLQL